MSRYQQQREKLYSAFVAKISQALREGVRRFPENDRILKAKQQWDDCINSGISRDLLVTNIVGELLPYEEDIKNKNESRVLQDLSNNATFAGLILEWKNIDVTVREKIWNDLSIIIRLGKAIISSK